MSTEPRPLSPMRSLAQKRKRMHLLSLATAGVSCLCVFGAIAAVVMFCPCANAQNFYLAALFASGLGWALATAALLLRAPTEYEIFCEYRGALVQLMALKHWAVREELYECVGPVDPKGDPSGSLGLRCRYPGSCLRHRLRRKYLRRDPDLP